MLPIVVFGLVRLFFRKFFKCLQSVSLSFFLFFQRMDVQKLPNLHSPQRRRKTIQLTHLVEILRNKKNEKLQKLASFCYHTLNFTQFPNVSVSQNIHQAQHSINYISACFPKKTIRERLFGDTYEKVNSILVITIFD